MADTFDPYREWLGMNFAAREYPLNHYQILDLERRDADSKTVVEAAEKMLARVRSQRPGSRAADWGRLLDEIETARDCLTNADRRAAYDAELVASSLQRVATPKTPVESSGASHSESLNLDQGAWAPPQFDAMPAEPESPAETAASAAPTSASPSSPPSMSRSMSTAPTTTPPQATSYPRAPYEQEDRPTPSDHADPPRALPAATAADPMAPVAIPVASPIASTVVSAAATPATAAPSAASSYNPVTSMPPEMPVAIQDRDETTRTPLSRTALFGIVAALLLWAAGMAAYFSGAFDTTTPANPAVTEDDSDPKKQPVADPPTPKKEQPEPPKEKVLPPKSEPLKRPKPDPPKPDPTPEPQPVPTPDALPTPDPVPNPEPPKPDPPAPPIPKPEPPTRDEIANFLAHLASARALLTKRDFAQAQQHLDDASQTALPAELEAKRERLQALTDATNDFWQSLAEAIASLEGGEEFKLSESTIIRIIEVNDRQLIIRISGQTKRYPVNDPPMGVARRLVAEWLSKDVPRTHVVFGASWATIPDADLDKARNYFIQAADAGVDTSDLIQALDDDYRAP